MNLEQLQHVYCIGIGGIGMSALASYFVGQQKRVAGYDKTETPITNMLAAQGVSIHYTDAIECIDATFLNPQKTLVIYTPAVPQTHTELQYFKSHGYTVLKRSEVLGLITKDSFCLAIAGTHGKTTTTSILAHLLYQCQVPLTAFLGGVSENYNSNFISHGTAVTVVEADEFDRSFLSLSPDFACITAMDADHLDIYGNAHALQKSFKAFTKCLKPQGKLFIKRGLPLVGITYGIDDDSDYSIHNIEIENGSYKFDVRTPKTVLRQVKFNMPGRHNLSNALIALAMAIEYGCSEASLTAALASYQGVKRRFTYHIKTENLVLIDDYAHHPEEINAVHQAVRELYPNKKILVIFQPHLYSRTRDFANAFAQSLAQFDALMLLAIYPARERPIAGVNATWLLDKINLKEKQFVTKNDLLSKLHQSDAQVILTLGAGDIATLVEPIKKELHRAN